MSIRPTWLPATALAGLCLVSSAVQGVTVQDPADVLPNGSAFLWVEGENVSELSGGDPADAQIGFILVNKTNPIQTITEDEFGIEVVKGGLDVLPQDANASGGAAIFHQLGGAGTAKWQVQFAIPATYYLYLHYSMYNRDSNTNYGNEDSIYVPPAFNKNALSDWIGFEGVDSFGDPKTGNSDRDGWVPLGKSIVSAGEVETHNSTDEDFWDGQFHWALRNVAVDMDETGSFVSDLGHAIRYEVTQADVGTVLDFEIAAREPYGAIDGLLFSTSDVLLDDFTQEQMDEFFLDLRPPVRGDFDGSRLLDLPDVNLLNAEIAARTNDVAFDLDDDSAVNDSDLTVWVKELRKTWFGDANLDGEFNSSDLVLVFQGGKFEQGTAATWDQGDWNGDLRFNSTDLVKAFQDGGFEKGPRAASAVPEPAGWTLIGVGIIMLARLSKRPLRDSSPR